MLKSVTIPDALELIGPPMQVTVAIVGIGLIALILLDAFETIVLPRRVQRSFRITSWFYRNTWIPWSRLSRYIRAATRRESFLGYFGPLSLILLLGFWAAGLILGFALMQYGMGKHVRLGNEAITFPVLLYHSGETFFTLGYGDITPDSAIARALAVMEAGMGFAFLGVVIGYLPVVYSAFSARETEISLLDSRAGSPPTAVELLSRLGCCPDQIVLDQTFRDWERWAAELLANHISYPVLSFFRSQHSNQSWLSALATMLDVTSLVLAGIDGIRPEQAQLTFAMARHAAVDLAQLVNARYVPREVERLTPQDLAQMREMLTASGLRLRTGADADEKLRRLRAMYEPYIQATGRRLLMEPPPWILSNRKKDNWQGGPWDKLIAARGLAAPMQAAAPIREDHF